MKGLQLVLLFAAFLFVDSFTLSPQETERSFILHHKIDDASAIAYLQSQAGVLSKAWNSSSPNEPQPDYYTYYNIQEAINFANNNWDCGDPACSYTVSQGTFQSNYECAEFVSRSLAAGGFLPGIQSTDPQYSFGTYDCAGYQTDMLSVIPMVNCLRSLGWTDVQGDIAAGYVVAGDAGEGTAYSHTCIGVGSQIVDCHNAAFYQFNAYDMFYEGINVVLAPPVCAGSCTFKDCGSDGCGTSCGSCIGTDYCATTRCVSSLQTFSANVDSLGNGYLAGVSAFNEIGLVTRVDDSWGGMGPLSSSPTGTSVTVAVNSDGRVELFWINWLIISHTWQSYPGGPFGPPAALSAAGYLIADELDVKLNYDGQLVAVGIVKDNGNLGISYQVTYGIGWSPVVWFQVYPFMATLAMNQDGRTNVFYIDNYGNLGQIWQITPGDMTTWSGASPMDATCVDGIALTATTDGTGVINLFYINEVANSQVYFTKQYLPNSGWGVCSSTSSYFYGATAIDVITNSDGRVEVFVLANNYAVYHIYESAPSAADWTWDYVGEGFNALANSGVKAINNNGTLEVFAIGQDNVAWHAWQEIPGNSTSWTSLVPITDTWLWA